MKISFLDKLHYEVYELSKKKNKTLALISPAVSTIVLRKVLNTTSQRPSPRCSLTLTHSPSAIMELL